MVALTALTVALLTAIGPTALWRHSGETNSYLKINGEVVRDTMNPNIPRHAIWRRRKTFLGLLTAALAKPDGVVVPPPTPAALRRYARLGGEIDPSAEVDNGRLLVFPALSRELAHAGEARASAVRGPAQSADSGSCMLRS